MNHKFQTLYSRISFCFLLVLSLTTQLNAQPDSNAIVIATTKVLHSKILGEDRKLYIHTPAGMKTDEAYPVLYLLDGGEHIEMVAGQITYLSESYKIIPQMIVIGIANTDRVRDLTPTHSIIGPDGKPDTSVNAMGRNSGGGERFLQFMKEELMPYIESKYPTAAYRILSGHSLGGLLGIYAMAYHPDYFNACIAISPSLQWDKGSLLQPIANRLSGTGNQKRVLFLSDAAEGEAFHRNQVLLDSLVREKQNSNMHWGYQSYPGEAHAAAPVKAFYDGIRTIFPAWFLPLSNAGFKKTVKATTVIAHYDSLSAIYGYKVLPPQDEINAIARFLRNDPTRISDAIVLLEMNAATHPTSSIVYETLGDTYARASDTPGAVRSYQKALQLAPANASLQTKLRKYKNE
jgi:predicted alpha/beta superfamily hydrolase